MGKIRKMGMILLVLCVALFPLCIRQPPTPEPTIQPTPEPTIQPTPEPTIQPTPEPTIQPPATPPTTPESCPFYNTELPPEVKHILAERHSPHLCFYKGFFGEEKYFPTWTEKMLDNATRKDYDRNEDNDCTGEKCYLDMGSEGCSIDPDLASQCVNDRYVYCRVTCCEHEGKDYIVIQYWFFYLFNDHVNDHEGEWEMILVLLDYVNETPIGAAYSRHDEGEYRPWDEIEKVGDHPKVYVAEGSHGAYFDEGVFSFQSHFDVVSDEDCRGTPGFELLSDQPWLSFAGNWGYRDVKPGFSGPQGPWYQGEKWSNPVGWAFEHEQTIASQIFPPFAEFFLSCPADMLITNSAGQRLGYENGQFVQEIFPSYVQDHDEEESYLIPSMDTYVVEISGTGTGTFDFALSLNDGMKTITREYKEVPVTSRTRAVLDLRIDFILKVDTDGDGTFESYVSPDSFYLYSSQPTQPLQVGTEMLYEIVLVNEISLNQRPSTFVFDVDPPSTWKYALSSDAVTLFAGGSETVYLSITAPRGTPMQEYKIRVEAISRETTSMSAVLYLVAKPVTTRCIDFESLPLEMEYRVGETFSYSGIMVTIEPFQWSDGKWTKDGYARVYSGKSAGGSGSGVFTNDANARFDFGCSCENLSLLFGSYGGNVNIEINGDFRNIGNIFDIDGTTIGGVNVSVVDLADGKGRLEFYGLVTSFAIGGQEFVIDDVCCQCTDSGSHYFHVWGLPLFVLYLLFILCRMYLIVSKKLFLHSGT